jgi:predicted PurR-regulated permease PerM
MAEPTRAGGVKRKDRIDRLVLGIAGWALVLGIVGGLVWLGILQVLLLVFFGVLIGVLLRSLADALRARSRLSPGWSLGVVVIVLAGLLIGGAALAAPRVAKQLTIVSQNLPQSFEKLKAKIEPYPWAMSIVRNVEQGGMSGDAPGLLRRITGLANQTVGMIVNVVIVIFLGLYFASAPKEHVDGLLGLFPPRRRERMREVMGEMGETLRLWMVGQLVPMIVIGLITWLGLWWIGVPMAATLGVLAGLFNFIPNFGPLASLVPAMLLAVSDSPEKGLWVLGLYVVAQTLEGYVLSPLVQKKMVLLPPALTISVQVLLGVLVGAIGVALAAPLTAVGLVLVKMLYVEDVLHEPAELPTEAHEKDHDKKPGEDGGREKRLEERSSKESHKPDKVEHGD